MALSNYSDLVAAINGWLSRSDMGTIAPDLIALAEAEFNRKLRTIEMEAATSATLTSDVIAVPSDFLGLRSIKIANTALEQVPAAELLEMSVSGVPTMFAVTDGQFHFRPSPSTGTVTISYYQKIPALTSVNTTNWLMTKHPDLYLFGALTQAEFYNWNDSRLPLIKSRVEEIMEQIAEATQKERYGGRRLVQGSRVYTIGVAA